MDQRDYMRPWWEVLDESRMLAYVEGQWVPFRYETCGLCGGRGKHVNPAIDSHGLTAEDFGGEDYFRGVYDVPCNACAGKRVVPVYQPPGKAKPWSTRSSRTGMKATRRASMGTRRVDISERGLRDLQIGIEGVDHLLREHGEEITHSAATNLETALIAMRDFWDELGYEGSTGDRYISVVKD